MQLYRTGIFRILVGGGANAALLEIGEGFNQQLPIVFYGMHGIFLIALMMWLANLKVKYALPRVFVLRDVIFTVAVYGIAAIWQSPISFGVIFIITIVGFLLTRQRLLTTNKP